ncbi:NMD3 family protein [Candidatus Norongarragalina meridionalis]|nr:NMD3 family protein [Candidatus Norongarragalina meridionalis]
MISTKICPRCGKEDDGTFTSAFCPQCEPVKHKRLPDEVVKCPKCNRYFIRGVWTKCDALGALNGMFQPRGYTVKNIIVIKRTKKTILEAELEPKRFIGVLLELKQCQECSLKSGGYHEAVIQVRGENREVVRHTAERLIHRISAVTFIPRVEEKKEGIDIQVGRKRAALEAVDWLHIPRTQSNKLIGMHEGKRLYRTSICIRV